MADQREEQNRSFTDRVGDKVMGSPAGASSREARGGEAGYFSGADARSTVRAAQDTSTAAGRTADPGYSGDTSYQAAPARDRAPGIGATEGVERKPIGALLRDFSRQLGTLVRMEAALAKTEMREKAVVVARNSMAAIVGGVLGLAGSIILLMAVSQALAAMMDAAGVSPRVYSWLSPLIVAAVVLGASYFMVKKGMDTIKGTNLAPQRTAESLRETGEWIKEKVS